MGARSLTGSSSPLVAARSVLAATGSSSLIQQQRLVFVAGQRRTFFGRLFGRSKAKKQDDNDAEANPFLRGRTPKPKLILEQDNLFHPLSTSPIPALRQRAERIKRLAPCPVHLRRGQRVAVQFDCPDCGWPTHYSEKEWREDDEHGRYVLRLREANEDEHDLRSGREMTEFRMPGPQGFEEAINMSSWDVFFYTRNFPSIETERSRRHVSKLLTFPTTVGAVLHENSPYTTRNRRLTREGMRSFLALRQMLHPKLGARPSLDSVRVFVVGSRAESTLPPNIWDQLRYMFPGVNFHLYLIGPEVTLPSDSQASPFTPGTSAQHASSSSSSSSNALAADARAHRARTSNYGPKAPSRTLVISEGLTMTYIQCNYEDVHHQMEPFDPYTDVFFAFSPGFGFPSQRAYDRPASSEEDEPVAATTSSAAVTAEQQQQPQQQPVEGGSLDTVAAQFESSQETDTKAASEAPRSATERLPQADATVSYQQQQREREEAEATDSASASTASTPSPEDAAAAAASTLPPGARPSSTLPTLPPLLQAQSEWAHALTQMLSTKCPLIMTGFSPADVRRDVEAFESVEGIRGEFEWLITPGENVFGSLSWSVADFDTRVAVRANWGVWAVRGKRYDLEGPAAYVNPFATGGSGREGEEQ